ncbi:MAG TPA: NAD(P)-dependent oxidoreductase [Chloroflexota bacterium]
MTCLITGLGYVGSAIAQRLLQQGEHVIGIENFFSTPRSHIERLQRDAGLQVIEGSVANQVTLVRAFEDVEIDTVFHLAGQASTHSEAAPLAETERSNYSGTRMLLEACAERRIRNVVIASSTRLYATPLPRQLTEEAPLRPRDPVHLSHLYGEILLERLAREAPVASWMALRLGTVHGLSPVMKTDERFMAVPQRFCWDAAHRRPLHVATGPEAFVALAHINDVVEAFLHSREHPILGSVANVASEVRSVAEIAEVVTEEAGERGIDASVRHWGRPRSGPQRTVSSALEATGFRPAGRIEDSVGAVLDYYISVARSGR